MKIAAVTDDGKTISAHFGRARAYVVVTVEDGKATERELRSKAGHHDFVHEPHEHGEHGHEHAHEHEHEHEHEHGHEHGRGHGWGAEAEGRHARMFAAIADCDVLLARGMGQGAYAGLQQAGIRPVVTTVRDIDAAVQAYLDGSLEDHPEKLH
jgi:predicted Fe-Mo cluster-binding NifX family protein